MSDPRNPSDDEPLVEAEGIDPDMPSTDDGPATDDDDDSERDQEDFFLSDLP